MLTFLLFIPALIATPSHNRRLNRRDVTTVYQPTTIYETVVANTLEGVYRKIRKIHKHRHEVIKQDRQAFEDELEQLNQQLDPYREYMLGQAAKYRQDVEEESDYRKSNTSNNSSYDNGHCREEDEWCCGKEGCDESEYEECNEGEEGCKEYDPDKELILREVDFDIYIVDVDEYVGTTIESAEKVTLTTVSSLELAATTL
ncbi:hypothetical protein MAM1_0082c04588 [Mucor ambiguus]|uniref:Uncharacterized protein n=1 Tax=Mucor ambiguus TaxID=91626 RepID=A0A0C9MCL2_9FUNG|nr:hypothetical protein MAM1_0082c04588 [Mucor ambiguus]